MTSAICVMVDFSIEISNRPFYIYLPNKNKIHQNFYPGFEKLLTFTVKQLNLAIKINLIRFLYF